MSLDQLPVDAKPERQRMIYVEESINVIDYEPFSGVTITKDQCTPIEGIMVGGQWRSYTHVIRKRTLGNKFRDSGNEPCRGSDKLVFFNSDVHGTFHWQAVYSTALFLDESHQVFTV